MNGPCLEEKLDIVNEADETIGSASRREIHSKGFAHRAVHIFVFNPAGQIYVQRRSATKDCHPLKLDSSAAGHVDSGESYGHAASRELMEELRIDAPLTEELRFGPHSSTDNERVVLFSCVTNAEPVPDPDEIIHGGFLEPSDLSNSMSQDPDDFVPAFILLWNMFRKTRQ